MSPACAAVVDKVRCIVDATFYANRYPTTENAIALGALYADLARMLQQLEDAK